MTLRLFHSPMACSLASRFALAESGLEHEVQIVSIDRGENLAEAYLRVNPSGKVPALETPDGTLTENPAILTYIADSAPDAGLLPVGTFQRAEAASWLAWTSSSLHPPFTRIFRPAKFVPEGADAEGVAIKGVADLTAALSRLDARLAGREFVLDQLSVCDLYLLVFALWRAGPAIAGQLPGFPAIDAWQGRLLGRPKLAACLAEDLKARAAAR